jgi:hypothetical protein
MADDRTQRDEDRDRDHDRGRSDDPYGLGEGGRRDYSQGTGGGGGGGGNNAAIGWIVFILIFGVGNIILYNTTGIVLIPIRR